jgi:uncharacterized protein (TIGR03083 family)
MNKEQVFAAVADERRAIADLIDGLTDEQLATPSLCSCWDVKTVAAHLVSVFADGFWGFQWAAVRNGGMHKGIDALARHRAAAPASEIAVTLRRRADHRLSPPITGPLSGLADVLVHGGDIRIPLQLPFEPDVERACSALTFLTGRRSFAVVPRGLLSGIRLYDSAIGQGWGDGDEVCGPVALLMMAAAGRADVLERLDGPGVTALRRRLSR